MPIGPWVIPAVSAGLGLLGSLFKQKPQEYRQTPLQSQLGSYMQRLLSQGGQGMSPELFQQYAQAYQVPQQAQWAMNLLPQIFGGMNFGGQGGMGGQGMQMPMQGGGGQPQLPYGMGQPFGQMGQGGVGGQPQMGFGNVQNPFAMSFARGGIVTGPTNAMLGEWGPEAVIPLGGMGQPQYGQMNPLLRAMMTGRGGMQGMGGQMGQGGGWGGPGGGGFGRQPFQMPFMM